MTELDFATEEIEQSIRLILERLPMEGYPSDEEGDLTNLSLYYRLRAIAGYLASGDTGPYVADLHRSGQVRLHYLQGCMAGLTGTERFRRTSRNRAFFDCLAINDLVSAEMLAERCDNLYVDSLEYEDDFLFVQWLQVFYLVLRGRRSADSLEQVLARFQRVVGEEISPFLSLCLALQARDEGGGEVALREIVERRSGNYARLAEEGALPTVVLQTERFIDVQAVAIVRLAALAELRVFVGLLPRVPDDLCEVAIGQHAYPPAGSWRKGFRGIGA
ncbi:immunity 49 family protein [Myxococcus sp. AM001]|uniref:immunity 49 family protein n=1 Tax=Myxococcus vastator TaxID=2709664 RepID=UPI0013D8D443|nr:immunity 49 family protein [Myxococcus vastator]NVJ09476.1 immunity 49 family protein [Myxococcus sp. AM001]